MSAIGVGDVVVRVGPCRSWRGIPHPLIVGRHYRVRAVLPPDIDGDVGLDIGVQSRTACGMWKAKNFRKIDAADDAFTASIRHRQPVEA